MAARAGSVRDEARVGCRLLGVYCHFGGGGYVTERGATRSAAPPSEVVTSSWLGQVVERDRRPEDLAAVACEQAHQLVQRRHDGICRGLGVRDRGTQADEELLDP